ncbi:MAG: sulfate/molybdate ABC transporter ATP-binding protein [Planctomycetota bacterium]|nr:sulfate/molybdate ABC transporter ATP-binding protein [Planctomycetota bacterium]
MGISVHRLSKNFGAYHALDCVSFEVPEGQLVALLGPSGSGKSTILRIIAGLESADSGEVQLTGADAEAPTRNRGVGFVFQHYALFRHMTVRKNIAFGLEARRPRPSRNELRRRVDELLDLVQLTGHADRYPSHLSGGQRQRVALARALAPRPKVLLLDEPFGALDARVRDELRTWLRRLHDEAHVTSLFVTHDQQEAFEVADQIIVLNRGKVEQIGPPQELYERPASPFVTEFLGAVNLLRVETVLGMNVQYDEAPLPVEIPGPHGMAAIYVRPHDLDITRQADGRPAWRARIRRITPLGGLTRLDLTLHDGANLHVELTSDRVRALALNAGEDVFVAPRDLKVFHQPSPFVENYVI